MHHGLFGFLAILAIAPTQRAPGTSGDGSSAPGARLDAIRASHEESLQAYREGLMDAGTGERRSRVVEDFLAAVVEHADDALDLARQSPGDPAALDALVFVIRIAKAGPSDHASRSIELMARDHVRDPRMGEACQQLFFLFQFPEAERLIRVVLDENPDHGARGLACLGLGQYLAYRARMVRFFRENPERAADFEGAGEGDLNTFLRANPPEALDDEAAGLFERVISDYSEVGHGRGTLGATARGELLKLRQLRVGAIAPEIEGEDVDGGRFALSDSRGKVVVLTFSGNWCLPCRALYPHERALVSRLAGRPFAMLSVNTDEDPETLRASVESGEITWRCWRDGGTDGPITTRWGVDTFPTTYVLDHLGIIRHRNIQGEALDAALDALIAEAEAEARP